MVGSIDDFCYWVLDLNKGIRFAGLASSNGKLIGYAYRRGLKPLASEEESEASVLNSFTKMNTRAEMESKFGKTIYAFALYKNVTRATIPVTVVKERSRTSLWRRLTRAWITSP
jgi:hypothetical protein